MFTVESLGNFFGALKGLSFGEVSGGLAILTGTLLDLTFSLFSRLDLTGQISTVLS